MPLTAYFDHRYSVAVPLLLAGVLLATPAQARCTRTPANFVPQDVRMDMGQVVILPTLPVGAVIRELLVGIDQRNGAGTCTGAGGTANGRYLNAMQQIAVPGFSDVHATDVAGVGVRVYRDSGQIQSYYPHTLPLSAASSVNLIGGVFRVELIKTANVTGSGPIAPPGRFTTYYFDGDSPTRPILTSTFFGVGTTVVTPTCSVQAGSRNIVVNFGSVPGSAFSGVGTRAAERDFSIGLDCQGSNQEAYQSRIGIRLDAAQDPSNLPGVLPITVTADAASGIAIEMVQRSGTGEQPLRFAQPIDLGLTTPDTRGMVLSLRARYIQTRAGRVLPGKANGVATFTIQYN
jgi:type 1 fimbria pilin